MATTTKKKTSKSKAKTTTSRRPTPAGTRTVVAAPEQGGEMFSSASTPVTQERVDWEHVLLFVNGSSKGQVAHGGGTLGRFLETQADRFGIRTFSAYVDQQKAVKSMANTPVSRFAKVEIIAKDSRGSQGQQLASENGTGGDKPPTRHVSAMSPELLARIEVFASNLTSQQQMSEFFAIVCEVSEQGINAVMDIAMGRGTAKR